MSLRDEIVGRGGFSLVRHLAGASAIVALQAVAAAYFVLDGFGDAIVSLRSGLTVEVVMECVVALALAGGVILGVFHVRRLRADLQRQSDALAVAGGALAEHIHLRFQQWRLTSAEADVALFALKGFQIAEIARLRNSALGTVRSQLSQVYAKAGVTTQSMLLALFFDELLQRREDTEIDSAEARNRTRAAEPASI